MTDYMTATRVLDEIGYPAGWDQDKQIEVLLGFIESCGLDAEFLTWALSEAGPAIVPATITEVRETRQLLEETRGKPAPSYVLHDLSDPSRRVLPRPQTDLWAQESWSGGLEDFLDQNDDTLSVKEVVFIRALQPGQSFDIGGGAQPRFRLTRIT
jgi:hypothetical protein